MNGTYANAKQTSEYQKAHKYRIPHDLTTYDFAKVLPHFLATRLFAILRFVFTVQFPRSGADSGLRNPIYFNVTGNLR
jgi:hypothetical protein